MNKKGFTLIELLVVLVIIGIIVALILPNTLKAIGQANDKECASNIRAINTAAQMCYTQTRDWTLCSTFAQLITPPTGTTNPFLPQTPQCPFGVAYALVGGGNPGQAVQTNTAPHFAFWPPVNPTTGQNVPHIGNTN